MIEHVKPQDIEARSFEIIAEELADRGIALDPEKDLIIRRAIHTSADFDYAHTLCFSDDAVRIARISSGRRGYRNRHQYGSDRDQQENAWQSYGGSARCYMADEAVAAEAKERGITRASVSMEHAARDAKASGKKDDLCCRQCSDSPYHIERDVRRGILYTGLCNRCSGRFCKCCRSKRADT